MLARQGRLPADEVATLPRVLIVGEGGAGKSTMLKQLLARTAAAGNVPVWVSLAQLPADAPLTIAVLLDHLVREAHARLGVGEVNRAFFESLVADGRLAIGFDALDECGSLPQRQRVRGLIEEVAREWKRCQVIVTSRPEALHDTPLPLVTPADPKDEQFRGLTPRPFARDDIAPFLRVAFDDGDKLAATLLNRTGIEALTATPLTLTLVGLVARTPQGIAGHAHAAVRALPGHCLRDLGGGQGRPAAARWARCDAAARRAATPRLGRAGGGRRRTRRRRGARRHRALA